MKTLFMAMAAGGLAMVTARGVGPMKSNTFGQDVAFLSKHTDVIVLSAADGGAKVALAPAYQGRVMTSTTGGDDGPSFGWLNARVIESGIRPPAQRKGSLEEHIHIFGGEDRFWLGPEGGQFSVFFKPGSAFDFASWQTPAPIDTDAFRTAGKTADSATFVQEFDLVNYSGTPLACRVDRTVRLLGRDAARAALGTAIPDGVEFVGYESDNRLTNRGQKPWTKAGGMPSVWILGMYKPSPSTTVVIPFKTGPESDLGPKVNDTYFGKVPPEYLVVKDGALFFKGDGTRRGKIGISPRRSKGIAGSFDEAGGVLNLVTYNVPDSHGGYVNSMWEFQKDPFGGDALNSYNDGSPEPGKPPLGPFYELETSSPAAALAPGGTIRHVSRTFHLRGPRAALDAISRATLGVGLAEIEGAF
ncbi:MAG: hypothetical protein KJ579_07885 [Verrucomicrobia bacterium]|nr:hypothetical protein [Verrucomicrobiota bacterium]